MLALFEARLQHGGSSTMKRGARSRADANALLGKLKGKKGMTLLNALRELAPQELDPESLVHLVALLGTLKKSHDDLKAARMVHMFISSLLGGGTDRVPSEPSLRNALAGLEKSELGVKGQTPRLMTSLRTYTSLARLLGEDARLLLFVEPRLRGIAALAHGDKLKKKERKVAAEVLQFSPAIFSALRRCCEGLAEGAAGDFGESTYAHVLAGMCSANSDTARHACAAMVALARYNRAQAGRAVRGSLPQARPALPLNLGDTFASTRFLDLCAELM